MLIVNRRSRAGKVVNLINLDVQRKGDVMAHHLKIGIAHQMSNIAFSPCEKVVNTQDIMSFGEQPFAQVGAEKARTTSYQNPHITYPSLKIGSKNHPERA